jgi:hypothetical protein
MLGLLDLSDLQKQLGLISNPTTQTTTTQKTGNNSGTNSNQSQTNKTTS